MSIEGNTLLSSTGLGDGQGDTEDGVGAELGLVGSAIEVEEELVDLALVLDVEVGLDELGADDLVYVLDGLENTLAAPLSLVTITKLASLMLTCDVVSVRLYSLVCIAHIKGKTNRWKHPRGRWRGPNRSRKLRHQPRRWDFHESRRRNEREPW